VTAQPARESFVQLRSGRFGHRLVCGVTNEQVTEPESVLTHEQRLVRSDELLADKRGQPRHELVLVGRQRLHRTDVEDPAFDGTPLENGPFRVVQLFEASGQESMNRRRNRHVGSP
jgi:hypothetical protein